MKTKRKLFLLLCFVLTQQRGRRKTMRKRSFTCTHKMKSVLLKLFRVGFVSGGGILYQLQPQQQQPQQNKPGLELYVCVCIRLVVFVVGNLVLLLSVHIFFMSQEVE